LRLLVLCCVLAQGAAAGASLALPGSEPTAAAGSLVLPVAARKGTRNYAPDAAPVVQDAGPAGADAASDAKALADCIAIWDAGTHITRSKWREICQRQLKERGPQLSGH
jgi:hypothetical protein